MKNFFRFENQPDWAPYLGNSRISPGSASPLMPLRGNNLMSGGLQQQPEQQMTMQGGGGGGMMPQQGLNIPVGKLVDAAKGIYDELKKPEYVSPYPNASNPSENYTGSNPWDPSHYEGTLIGDLSGNPTFDPNNYNLMNPNTSNPVFNPKAYEGTLYDPQNPFGLTEAQWLAQQEALNSGSLLEEGLGLGKNSDLTGGLSDMGGVGDEIADQTGNSGLMDNIGKGIGLANLAKGIYGLTQGSGGKGGVDLATGIGSQLMPGIGLLSGGFNAIMGIGQAIKGHGRQYNFYHPYGVDAVEDADGNRIIKFGSKDSSGDANDLAAQYSGIGKGNFVDDYSREGWAHPYQYYVKSKDGGPGYWLDPLKYIGQKNYDDFYGINQGYIDGVPVADFGSNRLPDNALSRQDYNDRLNALFLNKIATEGFNPDAQGVSQIVHGQFKDKGDVAFSPGSKSMNSLLRMNELENLYKNGGLMDISPYQNWSGPGIPELTLSPRELEQKQLLESGLFSI